MSNSHLYKSKDDKWSSHSKLIYWLKSLCGIQKVIEIGTANGHVGSRLKGRKFFLYGIEPNGRWAENAKKNYDQIFTSPLEDIPGEIFCDMDCILFADVIEHLINPEKELERVVAWSRPKTHFFISVPNIANIWVRINLLFGKFDYSEKGILDKTHLHFYTKETILKFVEKSSLYVEKIDFTPIPLNLVNSFFEETKTGKLLHLLLAKITYLFPTLLGYQIILFCRKRGS